MVKKLNLSMLDPKAKGKIEELLKTMGDSISMLYDLATHDEKTGIYNNKFFENMLEMEIEKARRGQEKLSLIITDIDFFKKVNDVYGHMKADELLERLARVLEKELRRSDVLARFGGEEFVVLLPETSLAKAKKLAKRLREAVHKDKILKKHNLTVSGGISEFRGKRDTKSKFKTRADDALYKAKKNGRDRFEVLR